MACLRTAAGGGKWPQTTLNQDQYGQIYLFWVYRVGVFADNLTRCHRILGGSKLLRFDKHKAQNRFGANKPFSFLLKNQTRLRKHGDFAHVGVDIGEVIVSWMAILGRKAQTGLQRAA